MKKAAKQAAPAKAAGKLAIALFKGDTVETNAKETGTKRKLCDPRCKGMDMARLGGLHYRYTCDQAA